MHKVSVILQTTDVCFQFVGSLFCGGITGVLSSFGKERELDALLYLCRSSLCFVSLTHGALSWSIVCACFLVILTRLVLFYCPQI